MSDLISKEQYSIDDLLKIMHRLRKECPWDAKQTHQSLKQFLLEETYEVLETIDQENYDKLAEELGDLLLQVVFHSELGTEEGRFDFNDVVNHIAHKLIHRHPHVFGDKQLNDAQAVQDNWEQSKVKDEGRKSLLSGIPKAAPALMQAQRLQEKAATVGFEWESIGPVYDKVKEEWEELKEAIQKKNQSEIEDEFGDLLFALVNLGRFLNVKPEDALRKTNQKFIRRFEHIEKQYNNDVDAMKNATLREMDEHWERAKKAEHE
ncbi:nucleoside triphosphate pyrophosphohydrolase [candidate division KSB1 bacterium]|nr:MAG: nucleoside triphosphate pyrophosphohydrolase [candidate division KSB1 bacterium]